MTRDQNWNEWLDALLTGVLTVWRLEGRVVRLEQPHTKCTVYVEKDSVTIERITDDGDAPYWNVSAVVSGITVPALPYAGIQGMLRAVRGLLDPDGDETRLIIGPQSGTS